MLAHQPSIKTLAKFEQFAALPASSDHHLEFIDGKLIESLPNEIVDIATLFAKVS